MENTIVLVDKPVGISSFDVIRKLQKRFGKIKMGHAGTLDPLASGLMIIATGKKTKELTHFLGLPKTYSATIRFGIRTTTGDVEGDVLEEKSVPHITCEDIENVLRTMEGKHEYFVPLYSAIKKNGKPLYAYARKGEAVEVPKKVMEIKKARCNSYENNEATVWFDVGSGAYIRSLAETLGERLGTVAHLTSLRRLTIGEYSVDDPAIINNINEV